MKYLRMKAAEVGTSSTAEVIRICVNEPPQGGMKVDEIRSRLRVLDAIDKAGTVLAIEDADAKVLQRCVASMSWKGVRPDILEFSDAVANLADVPPVVTSNGAAESHAEPVHGSA